MYHISEKACIGKDVVIKDGVVIEDNVTVEDGCYIDYGAVIKENVTVGKNSFIGAQCILGEFLQDFFAQKSNQPHPLKIGEQALLRSGTILYGDSKIGDHFQTGHRAVVREKSEIGHHVSIGTFSDIQGDCKIGNYVRIHSNVFLSMKSCLKDYVWIFPHVVFTDDPMPPSNTVCGATVEAFACICARALILPGIHIGREALIAAGSTVTKDVEDMAVVMGNPAKPHGTVTGIKEKDGSPHYPWRNRFERGMPWCGTTYEEWVHHQKEIEK